MQCAWLLTIVFALIAAVCGQNCPANFKLDQNKLCTAERPIHGECPPGSLYKIDFNKCVWAARG